MKQHVTIAGVLHIVLSIIAMLGGIIVMFALFGTGFIAMIASEEAMPMGILAIVGFVIGSFIIILSIPGIIGGYALLKYQPWARILVIILSVLQLLNLPIGTALGIYSIWVLTHEETRALFDRRSY